MQSVKVPSRSWTPFLEKQGPAGAYVASLPAADRDALRLRLRTRLFGAGPDKAIVMRARVGRTRRHPMTQMARDLERAPKCRPIR